MNSKNKKTAVNGKSIIFYHDNEERTSFGMLKCFRMIFSINSLKCTKNISYDITNVLEFATHIFYLWKHESSKRKQNWSFLLLKRPRINAFRRSKCCSSILSHIFPEMKILTVSTITFSSCYKYQGSNK